MSVPISVGKTTIDDHIGAKYRQAQGRAGQAARLGVAGLHFLHYVGILDEKRRFSPILRACATSARASSGRAVATDRRHMAVVPWDSCLLWMPMAHPQGTHNQTRNQPECRPRAPRRDAHIAHQSVGHVRGPPPRRSAQTEIRRMAERKPGHDPKLDRLGGKAWAAIGKYRQF